MKSDLDFETAYRRAVLHKGEKLLPRGGPAEAIFDFTMDWNAEDLEDSQDEYNTLKEELDEVESELQKLELDHEDFYNKTEAVFERVKWLIHMVNNECPTIATGHVLKAMKEIIPC